MQRPILTLLLFADASTVELRALRRDAIPVARLLTAGGEVGVGTGKTDFPDAVQGGGDGGGEAL